MDTTSRGGSAMMEFAQQLVAALAERIEVTPIRGGELVTTPFDLDDHTPIDLAVTRLDHDHYLVSDRGLIADRLDMAGARIESDAVKASWEALTASLPVVLADVESWEIASTTDRDGLGDAMLDVATTAMQADMLHVLASKWHPLSLGEELTRHVASKGIAVTPKATVSTRNGGSRHVSFSATGDGGTAYVKALGSSASFMGAYDSAYATFSTMISPGIRACVIDDDIHVRQWQREDLESVSRVSSASDSEQLWADLQKCHTKPLDTVV